jgi:hypothetical protein
LPQGLFGSGFGDNFSPKASFTVNFDLTVPAL